jgi:PHD/YefM family antitoxin component YafN of YafNO toxin-antitoxin module
MNSIPAQEIKRRGIAAVDDALKKGPVHVIRNNQPKYVVITEEQYQDLARAENEAHMGRVRESLEDVKAGRVRTFERISDLLHAIEQEEQCTP